MALQTPDAAIRQLAAPLARVGDAGLVLGLLALLGGWSGIAPAAWSLPALLLVASGFTIATIGRAALRETAADEAVTALSRTADSELLQFRGELMQPARGVAGRLWSGVGAAPAPGCRWRVGHALCAGYAAAPREQLCSCNCHRHDALGLTGRDHASLWLDDSARFTLARRRSLRGVEA